MAKAQKPAPTAVAAPPSPAKKRADALARVAALRGKGTARTPQEVSELLDLLAARILDRKD